MQRREIRFTGRVQGIGFRATAAHTARNHPVTGWVRNEPDGAVTLQAQGNPDTIDAFLQDLRTHLARYIQAEHAQTIPPAEGETAFRITH